MEPGVSRVRLVRFDRIATLVVSGGAMTVRSFRDLIAWNKAFDLSLEVHRVAEQLPASTRFGLASELAKTSRSIVYNIAEGHQRGSTREYGRFLGIALGSQAELETQILLAIRLGVIDGDAAIALLERCAEVGRVIRGLSKSLRRRGETPAG